MDIQDSYMDFDSVSYENDLYRPDETDSNSWIESSCCNLDSPTHLTETTKISSSCLALPELPLQPTISADLALMYDFDKQEVDRAQNKGMYTGSPIINEEKNIQFKRLRSSEVHNSSERRRRHRINEKLKTLQQLIPHCEKSDKAQILEEAAKYIKALKLQVEAMGNPDRFNCNSHQQMNCLTNQTVQYQFQTPIRPHFGMSFGAPRTTQMCAACSVPLTPFFQLPLACLPFPYSSGEAGPTP